MTSLAPDERLDPQTLANMLGVAHRIMSSRDPDQVLGGDYLYRWFVTPKSSHANFYLHRFMRSDNDVPHDHPWDNTSILLDGTYCEVTPAGVHMRMPGDVVTRKATDAHRIVLGPQPVISFFFTGPKIREWGFHDKTGWIHWRDFFTAQPTS